MQLLTPLIRARIQSMVLDAIARIPPNIRPTDSRFLEWLESLIRYHAQHPMEPAAEKPPVLGGIGVADQHHAFDGVLDDLYIETGVNDPGSVGLLDPDRYLPGTWKTGTGGDGAPDSGVYQGLYNSTEATYDAENESLAIGEGDPPLTHAGEAVFQKKLMVGYFPPSSFNGMMRHYMQSYYGADNELTMQFHLDTVGTEIVLKLPNIQIGFNSSLSVGILHVGADNNLDYRFIVIESPEGGGLYSVKECDIIFPLDEDARDEFEDAGTSDADREKVLTYLFGHSKIDDNNFRTVDTFQLDNEGTDAWYGWKFDNAGTKASICLNELYEDPGGKEHYDSSEITVEFDVNLSDEIVIDSVTESVAIRWHHVSNVTLWRPNADFTTSSRVYNTLLVDRPTPYNYTNAPVYCWYDKEDVLQVIKLSHTEETFSLKSVFDWSPNIIPNTTPVTDYDHLREGWVEQDEARWMSEIETTNGTTDQLSVNAIDYDMESYFGSYNHLAVPEGVAHTDESAPENQLYGPFVTFSSSPNYSTDRTTWREETRNPFQCKRYFGIQSRVNTSGSYWVWEAVTGHIPLRDAEGFLAATLKYSEPTGTPDVAKHELKGFDAGGFVVVGQYANGNSGFGAVPITIDPFYDLEDAGTRWGPAEFNATQPDPEEIYGEIAIHLHTRTLEGDEGVYDGSVDLFFFRSLTAEDPPGKILAQSWGVDALYGTDVGALGDDDTDRGFWSGWI